MSDMYTFPLGRLFDPRTMKPDRGPNLFRLSYSAEMAATDRLTELAVTDSVPQERGDAARNRLLLLDAARRLIGERGADGVSMDDIAAAAGVGKGTLFRRFGSRAGLMMVLLDQDERAEQQAFLFGPPPLGPGAPPVQRLVAYGRERLRFVERHQALLADAGRDPQTRYSSVAALHRAHVRMLLESAATTGDLDAQTDALLALLDADYVGHQLTDRGLTLDALGDAWESVARKLCGR
jgi:AcrR family transcriptional regulator